MPKLLEHWTAVMAGAGVAECPTCEAAEPDADGRGFCSACGALFRDRFRSQWRLTKIATVSGLLLVLVGAALTLYFDLGWIGLAVLPIGLAPLGYGIYSIRRQASSLLTALAIRAAPETLRLLTRIDRFSAGLIVLFVGTFSACIPYYLYIERPRLRLSSLNAAFEEKIPEYLSIVPADAEAPDDGTPRLIGKAVVIDKRDGVGTISGVHAKLPPEIRAASPDEVDTVVWIEWKDFKWGHYNVGNIEVPVYQVNAHMTLVDADEKVVLGTVLVMGPAPTNPPPADGRGARPVKEAAARLVELSKSDQT